MSIIEDLLDLQIPTSIRLSPDGKQVLYSTALGWGGKKGEHHLSTIWLAETGKQKSARQLTPGVNNDKSPKWAADGESIAFVSDRAKQGESSAIYVLPLKGGEAYPVTTADNERPIAKFEWSPDGKSIAFLSADEKSAEKKAKEKEKDDVQVFGEDWDYNRLRLLHVSTKKVTMLVAKDVHIIDFAWNDDSTALVYASQRTPHVESPYMYGTTIEQVSLTSKAVSSVGKYPHMAGNFYWAGQNVYFLGKANPEFKTISSSCVYEVPAKGGDFSKCAYGDEECAFDFSKAQKEIVVKVQRGLEDSIRILNGKTLFSKKKSILKWDSTFMYDSDEMVVAIAQGDVGKPAEVYTTTASGGALVQLSDHGHPFADKKLGTCTHLECQSGDGKVSLDGLYLTPSKSAKADGTPEKPLPTVVVIHGGPYWRDTDAFDTAYYGWTPLLLNAGYGVICPNYRGSSARGDDFAAYTRAGVGQYDQPDIITMTQHCIEKGYADKERLIVSGWSQGGYLSFLNAVRNGMHEHGWKFKAAIPGAGISDWDAMAMTSDVGCLEVEFAGNAPWNMEKTDVGNRRGSPLWEFGKAARAGIVPPMLILHGEKDERCPITQAWAIHRGMIDFDIPCEMVTYPREGHVVQERKHLVDMLQRLQRFCDTHLS